MHASQLLDVAPFLGYLSAILALFVAITRDLISLKKSSKDKSWKPALFGLLALGSFVHTWFYMGQHLKWSYDNYVSTLKFGLDEETPSQFDLVSMWLRNTMLFEEAWLIVCREWSHWWWSEQLCLFTAGAWTVFVYQEGRAKGIPRLWQYMLLGHLVAVSVAANFFFLALALSPSTPTTGPRRAPYSLLLAVTGSFLAIYYTPQTDDKTFLPVLIAMHAFLFLPLIDQKHLAYTSPISLTWTYIASAAIALLLRVRSGKPPSPITAPLASSNTTIPLLQQPNPLSFFLYTHIPTLYFHPAQSSIGWDVIWSTASFLIWEILRPGGDNANKLIALSLAGVLTLLWGVGFAAPVVWAMYA